MELSTGKDYNWEYFITDNSVLALLDDSEISPSDSQV